MSEHRIDRWARLLSRGASRRRVATSVVGGAVAASLLPRLPAALAQAGTPCPPPTPEEMAAIAEAYFDAFNAGDAEALGELLDPAYTHQGAVVAEQDRDLHLQRLEINRAAFPDGRYDLGQIIVQGDLVAVRHVFTGTLQGPYAGVEPAGQEVAVRAVHIHRVACGKIIETWNNGDALGLLRQIGALPPAPPVERTEQAAAGTPAATPGDCPATTAEENATIARRWTEEAWDKHDPDALDAIVAPDVIHHAGLFVDEIGIDEIKRDLLALVAAFPDIRFTADVVVADDTAAAVRWTGRGTNDGELMGLPPTGKAVVFTGTNVYRIACGMIVEGWSEPDSLGLLRQLGLVPENGLLSATPEA